MALFSVENINIAGISAAIPKEKISNTSLKIFNKNEVLQFIKTTGINFRRISGKLSASLLCIKAAQKLLEDLSWATDEIDVLIFISQTPDQPVPGTATAIQTELGLPKSCMVLDINQGCSGYVYGLAVLSNLLSVQLKKGLLLVGDTITDIINPNDRSVVPIFSDAGSATALEFKAGANPMHFNLQSDGSGKSVIEQKRGSFMKMKGIDVFNFGLREVVPNIVALTKFCSTPIATVDYLILHQANLLLNESIRKKLDVSKDKVPYSLKKYGNTSNASLPLTMVDSIPSLNLKGTHSFCISGFGVGLLWGSCIAKISDIVCSEILEI